MTDKEKELQAEAIGYLRNRIAELEMTVGTLRNFSNEQATCIEKLEAQIEKMKCPQNCKYYPETHLCFKGNGYCICDKWELRR